MGRYRWLGWATTMVILAGWFLATMAALTVIIAAITYFYTGR